MVDKTILSYIPQDFLTLNFRLDISPALTYSYTYTVQAFTVCNISLFRTFGRFFLSGQRNKLVAAGLSSRRCRIVIEATALLFGSIIDTHLLYKMSAIVK